MTEDTHTEKTEYSFMRGGLLYQLFTKTGLAQPGLAGVGMRVGWFIALTYVTILVLSLFQGVAWNPALRVPFLFDIAESCRYLFVGPLLIASEAFVEPWLSQIVRQARERLIPKEELTRFENLITRTIRFRDSFVVEALLILGSFGLQWVEVHVLPHTTSTSWHQLPGSGEPTYAYLWCVYFAKPLIRFLWLRWLWRYTVWSVFLLRLALLRFNVVPIYPDRNGGLEFISVGHGRFAVVALAFGAQVASMCAELIIYEGKSLASFKYEIAGVVIIVLLVFLTPLLAFSLKLLRAKRLALYDYGALANEYTSDFHNKWIGGARGSEALLGTADIQALADMGNSYQVVREMKLSLINKDIILTFVVATLLPFLPLVLIVYPVNDLIKYVLKAVM
jgi:hypothetical protein